MRVFLGLVIVVGALVGLGGLAMGYWSIPGVDFPRINGQPADPPYPATLTPVASNEPIPDNPVQPNPSANDGAPVGGTPFGEKPVDPNVPISDGNPLVDEHGNPITLPPAPTETPTPSPTASASATPSPSATPSASPTATASATPTASPTPSPSGTPSATPTATASASPTPSPTATPSFLYFRPSLLEPGTGLGANNISVLAPDMAFPIKSAPTFLQSQVYRWGGGVKGGSQCDARNFRAPWRDNYCEKRSTTNTTPWCAETGVHMGQDIRVGTPEGCTAETKTKAVDRTRYEIVAVEDGVISNVGSYSITLRANSGGRIYRYLHLNMAKLKVKTGDEVVKGQVVGYVSNDFGGTPTTLHLHFELKINTAEAGFAYAPPYSSLLAAYQRREGNPGAQVSDSTVVASSPR